MSSIIVIEFVLTLPNIGRRKLRGQINLFELLPFKPNATVCMQVPALTKYPIPYSSDTDCVYLSFNVSMIKEEYLLSQLQLQIEFSDSTLFNNIPSQ